MIIYHSNGTEVNRFDLTDPTVASFSTSIDRTVTVTWGSSSGDYFSYLSKATNLMTESVFNFFFNFVGPDLLNPGQYYIKVEAGNCYRNTYNDIAKCFSEVEQFQG